MHEHEIDPSHEMERLLAEAGYSFMSGSNAWFVIPFSGRHREWFVWARTSSDWVHLRTFLCDVPAENVLREKLRAFAVETNAKISLAKLGEVNGQLAIDVDYRREHVDAPVLQSLVGLIHAVSEEQYPAVFRIVSGDATLEQLEASIEDAP